MIGCVGGGGQGVAPVVLDYLRLSRWLLLPPPPLCTFEPHTNSDTPPVTARGLLEAVRRRNMEMVEACLAAGTVSLKATDAMGRSCLHLAAAQADPEMLALLVGADTEVDVDVRDQDGCTPLHVLVGVLADAPARVAARVKCVQILLQSAARVSERTLLAAVFFAGPESACA